MLIFPTIYSDVGGLLLQWWLDTTSALRFMGRLHRFYSGIASRDGRRDGRVSAREHLIINSSPDQITSADIHDAAIEGAVHRLRPKLMTVFAVLARSCTGGSLWESRSVRMWEFETDCGSHCWGNDHLHDSRTDFGAGVFCTNESRALRHGTLKKLSTDE